VLSGPDVDLRKKGIEQVGRAAGLVPAGINPAARRAAPRHAYLRARYGTLAVLAAGLLAGAARADRLDQELHQRMPGLVAELKKEYKSAGVLRFRVQEGEGRESLTAPLCGRMVELLETLVMIHNGPDESKALGLVRDAGKVAGRHGIRSFARPADRKKLFELRYPMAWGSDEVTPEVFLTGKVTLSQDRRKTTVALEAFDRKNPAAVRNLATLSFPTDRGVLRDLGYGFALSRSGDRRDGPRGAFDGDDDVIISKINKAQPVKEKGAAKESPPAPSKPAGGAQGADNIGGLSVKILVGAARKPARIRPSYADGDGVNLEVMSPAVKEKVVFRLKNTTGKDLGVVLRLNGVNTLFEQKQAPEQAAKWRIPAKSEIEVEGFVLLEEGGKGPGGTVKTRLRPFKVLVEAEEAKFGDGKGLIDIDVFEEAGGKGPGPAKPAFSGRGLPPSREQLVRQSYLGLRNAVLKSSGLKSVVKQELVGGKVVSREMIGPADRPVAGPDMKQEDFVNPVLVARQTIKVLPNDEMKTD
jgi:hypothetical protein